MRRELEMDKWRQQQGIAVDPDKYGGLTPLQVWDATELAQIAIKSFIDG